MKKSLLNSPDPLLAISQFLSSDFLQEEIQELPNELQKIFDCIYDTDYGNCIETRRKMLRIKEIISQFATALKPFTEEQVQQACEVYKTN